MSSQMNTIEMRVAMLRVTVVLMFRFKRCCESSIEFVHLNSRSFECGDEKKCFAIEFHAYKTKTKNKCTANHQKRTNQAAAVAHTIIGSVVVSFLDSSGAKVSDYRCA